MYDYSNMFVAADPIARPSPTTSKMSKMAAPFVLSQTSSTALHRSLDAGFLLPTEWYSDPEIFCAELERVHRRAWHFAAHTGELKAPGDVYIRNLAGVPIVLVREGGGAIRGFINICRHRGHPVVMEVANRLKLRCHFHGWTYGLDGKLQHAPRGDSDPTFDPAAFSLVPIQTHVWGPMIWANIDLAAPSFADWIEGMPELMLEHGLDVHAHVFGFDHEWEINSNWKVFQDNTIECYHCPTTHPELSRVLEMNPEKQELYVGGSNWIHHTIPFRSHFKGSLTTQPHDGRPFNYYYHWVFPSTYLQFAGKGFDIGSLDIIAPDKIRFRHICFLPPDTPAEALASGQRQLAVDATIWQDIHLCNRVQAGHTACVAPMARIFPRPESLITHFQHRIVEMVADSQAMSAERHSP
jgi:phenylpropionate dioxygenase-like ring-hydroxylating dioxygenase large terminal subunit